MSKKLITEDARMMPFTDVWGFLYAFSNIVHITRAVGAAARQ